MVMVMARPRIIEDGEPVTARIPRWVKSILIKHGVNISEVIRKALENEAMKLERNYLQYLEEKERRIRKEYEELLQEIEQERKKYKDRILKEIIRRFNNIPLEPIDEFQTLFELRLRFLADDLGLDEEFLREMVFEQYPHFRQRLMAVSASSR
jgi:DNA repair ATPase RecN